MSRPLNLQSSQAACGRLAVLHTYIAAGRSGVVAQYGRSGTLPAEYETGIDQLHMWDYGSWKRLGLRTGKGKGKPRSGRRRPR